jgi:hypothetical protein
MNDQRPRLAVNPKLPVAIGAFLFLFYLLTFPGTIAPRVSDGRAMYLVTQSLVDRHSIAIYNPMAKVAIAPGWKPIPIPASACPAEPAVIAIAQSKSGPAYSKFGIGQSLAAVPLYILGTQLAKIAPGAGRAEIATFVTSSYTAIVTALTAALLCALALRLGWSPGIAAALSLMFGIATPAWAYTTNFFSEPTIGLCLLGAVAAVLWTPRSPRIWSAFVAGAWLALALLTHVADTALYVPLFALFLLARSRRTDWIKLLVALAVPLVAAAAIIAMYNAARFGSVFITGYGIAGDLHDLHPPRGLKALWEGIYGPTLSSGKGLVFYAPPLLLAPWALVRFAKIDRAAAWLLVGIIVATVLAHANTLIVWLGGWAWGPRFLIPILPIAILPLGALLHRSGGTICRLVWLLALLGAVIQVPAVFLDKGAYISHLQSSLMLQQADSCIWHVEDLYKWHPEYTPLIGQWEVLLDPKTYTMRGVAHATASGIRLEAPTSTDIANGIFTPSPHPWWALLDAQGAPRPVLAAIEVALALGALLLLWLVLRLAGEPTADTTIGGGPARHEESETDLHTSQHY